MTRIGVLCAVAACVVAAALAGAQPAGSRPGPLAKPAGKHPKLASSLDAIAEAARVDGPGRALALARAGGEDTRDSRVAVELEATGSVAPALRVVRRAGGRVVHVYGGRATVLLAPQALERVAAAKSVRLVRERTRPFFDALPGEGVAATGAPAWHAAGWTGAGVKIGIIDGGFGGYRERQASGDLPASVAIVDLCQLTPFTAIEHGTAVAEIAHEMAPAAELHLICVDDGVALGEALAYARAEGIQIVNHSAAWFNTWRGDGTGPRETPEGVVAAAGAAGILWVNSAGNYARAHWAGRFSESGAGFHQFAPGDRGNTFTLAPRTEACVFLKWDDWPVTAQDFDLFVYRDREGAAIAAGIDEQFGQQEPREQTCFSFDGEEPEPFSVVVRRNTGFGTPRLDIVVPGARLEYQTAAGSLGEPASAPAALAVGAVCWQTRELEPYSSQGPTVDGRRKPELAGPDSVSSATYGAFAQCGDHVGFPGTSASAPHVAGAAALVRHARPSWTAAQIAAFLQRRAADIGVRGRDNQTGAGALALATPLAPTRGTAVLRAPQVVAPPAIQGTASPGRKLSARAGRWRGSGALTYRFAWLRCTIDGGRCAKTGKAGKTYAVTAGDGDYTLRLSVTVTNAAGSRTAVSTATDPVPGAYATEPGDELVLYAFSATPSPRAGGALEANVRVVHIDGTFVLGAAVRCSATAGSRRLAVTTRRFVSGLARCIWRVPPNAAGARITGTVTVVARGRTARQRFTVRAQRR